MVKSFLKKKKKSGCIHPLPRTIPSVPIAVCHWYKENINIKEHIKTNYKHSCSDTVMPAGLHLMLRMYICCGDTPFNCTLTLLVPRVH